MNVSVPLITKFQAISASATQCSKHFYLWFPPNFYLYFNFNFGFTWNKVFKNEQIKKIDHVTWIFLNTVFTWPILEYFVSYETTEKVSLRLISTEWKFCRKNICLENEILCSLHYDIS